MILIEDILYNILDYVNLESKVKLRLLKKNVLNSYEWNFYLNLKFLKIENNPCSFEWVVKNLSLEIDFLDYYKLKSILGN